jgi:hypothetical protein
MIGTDSAGAELISYLLWFENSLGASYFLRKTACEYNACLIAR